MSKKEMLKKQNERNRLRRKNKEKLLATLLTSGLLTCAINAQPVLANTLESSIDTASIQSRASSATIEKQTVVINKLMPSDVVIRNVNFNGLDVQYLNIYTYRISGSELIISEEEGTITIPREVIETKIIPNITVKSCVMSIIFSDQSYLSGQVSVKITEDEIILPPAPETLGNAPDDNKEPGNGDVSEEETPETPGDDNNEFVGAPDIKHEQVTFDYKEPKDIVLENLDLKGLKITKFFINNVEVNTSYLDVTENSITISKDAFLYLSLYNGVNSVEFHFSNGSVISNALEVTTINNKDKVEDDEITDDNITDDDNSNNGGITDDDNDNTDEIVDDSITDSVIDKDNTIITTSPNTNSSAVSSNTITANTSVNLKLFLYILI
ncbi:MAG: hypothetical protein E7214_11515 [Clostridium sp.]|nr:hypothetical protein [Clostridium sp.]